MDRRSSMVVPRAERGRRGVNEPRRTAPADRWQELWARFHELTGLDPHRRAAALGQLERRDPALAAELSSLLASHDAPHPLLDGPGGIALDAPPTESRSPESSARLGLRLGPYRLVEKLGEGGMGVVYRAERVDGGVTQQVAVKLLTGVAAAPSMVERFRREREILARLDHPSIARLIDVGDDPDGLPYVVMEYVDGGPIDAYCDRAGLGLRERLELLEAVCAAVDVAHRSLVVHRDLKPSNVLVTRGGEPKLVDFGIARRLDDEDATLGTSRLLTPRWASPEQLRGGPVTTAADVHALGLLLCHLLTGRLPYRSSSAAWPLLAREILEEAPLRPSSLVSANDLSGDEASADAGRFLSGRELARRLRGDLDAIVLRALAKEPNARYRSAADLAADLRRHLDGFPIEARVPGPGLRLRKLIARRPWSTAAFGGFLLTVAIFTAITTGLNLRLNRSLERVRAERANAARERQVAVETADFLEELFRSVAPAQARGEEPTVRQVVDAGAARLLANEDAGPSEDPAARAELLLTLAEVYASLSALDRAESLATRAAAIGEGLDGTFVLADSLAVQARIHHARGEYAKAAESIGRALQIYESSPRAESSVRRVIALTDLGTAQIGLGQGEVAERSFRRALELSAGDGSRTAARRAAVARTRLGSLLRERGDLGDARELLVVAIRDLGAEVGLDHPDTVQARRELADTLRQSGEHRQALEVLESVLADAERVFSMDHVELAPILDRMSVIHQALAEWGPAERLQRRALAIRELHAGADSARTTVSVNNLGWLLHDQGRYAEADALYRRALETGEAKLGADHPSVAISLNNLGLLALDRGRSDHAIPYLERSLAVLTSRLGPEHPARAFPLTNLGIAHLELGEPARAEVLLEEALELRRGRLPPGHEDLAPTLVALGRLHCESGRIEDGESSILEALAVERGRGVSSSFGEALAELELGACRLRASRAERGREGRERAGSERAGRGRELVTGAISKIVDRRGSGDPRVARARSLLAAHSP